MIIIVLTVFKKMIAELSYISYTYEIVLRHIGKAYARSNCLLEVKIDHKN